VVVSAFILGVFLGYFHGWGDAERHQGGKHQKCAEPEEEDPPIVPAAVYRPARVPWDEILAEARANLGKDLPYMRLGAPTVVDVWDKSNPSLEWLASTSELRSLAYAGDMDRIRSENAAYYAISQLTEWTRK
jgi:hypothetical protein